jgi:hypothetical protein
MHVKNQINKTVSFSYDYASLQVALLPSALNLSTIEDMVFFTIPVRFFLDIINKTSGVACTVCVAKFVLLLYRNPTKIYTYTHSYNLS